MAEGAMKYHVVVTRDGDGWMADVPALPGTTSPEDTGASPRHPLDPLTGAEIEAATSILKRDRNLADSARFVYVTLREPPRKKS